MKKSLLALAIASTLGVSAYGTPPKPVDPSGNSSASSTAEAESQSEASAEAHSRSSASLESSNVSSSVSSSGDSSADSNSGGNTLSNTTVYKQRRQAPGVYTAATNTTAYCQAEWHIGASSPLGGLSFGKSRTVRDCALAAAADAEGDRGNFAAAIQLRCRISFYQEIFGEDCIALLNTQDGSGRLRTEVENRSAERGPSGGVHSDGAKRSPEQKKADRDKLLKEVSK